MMADAPHPNATYAWFDFIERPEVQAAETEYNGYATPNLEAKKLVPQEMLDDPAIFPPGRRRGATLEGADPAVHDRRRTGWRSGRSSSPASAAERQRQAASIDGHGDAAHRDARVRRPG